LTKRYRKICNDNDNDKDNDNDNNNNKDFYFQEYSLHYMYIFAMRPSTSNLW